MCVHVCVRAQSDILYLYQREYYEYSLGLTIGAMNTDRKICCFKV